MNTPQPAPNPILAYILIADILGVSVIEVSPDFLFDYRMGWLDEGSSCALWLRDYRHGAVTEDWPGYLPTLLTDGSGGE